MHPLREELFVLLNRGAASASRFFRLPADQEGDTGSGDRCWVLDPIDGTNSFVAGRRAWGSLNEPARPIRVSDEPKTGGMRWSSGPTVEELDVGERARLDLPTG